ncbi:MAG: PDZ domain-containing protein [Pseudanabaenaceae cyanobacterium bins.68]|nr:PDZ domain-containing protein [Pseudanabaenaceae cyanobacterium bins.68]
MDKPVWHYRVSMPNPQNHLFTVELEIQNWTQDILTLELPVWTPGSYLVREYAKHLESFAAYSSDRALEWAKTAKNRWVIHRHDQDGSIKISYQIYANDLSVRTNHLDHSHGYFNGAAMFMYSPDLAECSYEIEIVPPDPSWQIATALPQISDRTFWAKDFDTLADSPFEIGIHQRHEFEVLGKPHTWVIWGQGNLEVERLIPDTTKIIQTTAQIFGGLPYDRYLFILHLSANSYGGLEHCNCCSLIFPRLGFRGDSYLKFLHLVAHEFFHLWNVKRLRPQELVKIDYNRENYTEQLWFAEGVTSYYDQLLLVRSGLVDQTYFLYKLGETITKLQLTPGRQVQSLAESSFDTWIKLYRPEPNSANSQISYYLKGELVSLLLDLHIRICSNHQVSLDQILVALAQNCPDGYSHWQLQSQIQAQVRLASDADMDQDIWEFWQSYISGTEELDYDRYLNEFGLELVNQPGEGLFTGLSLTSTNGFGVVKYVARDSPAERAGLNIGDEILAIAGIRVTGDQFNERLKLYGEQKTVELSFFRQEVLSHTQLELLASQSDRYLVQVVRNPTPQQAAHLEKWLQEPAVAM